MLHAVEFILCLREGRGGEGEGREGGGEGGREGGGEGGREGGGEETQHD